MRYSAFLSYNHRDRRWASWLHRAIETYGVPARLVGQQTSFGVLGKRLPPVFQDREELATSGSLAQSVRDALAESANLIVICSPNASASRWVNDEIRVFAALGRRDRVQCLIVDGEPHARDPARECLPPALLEDGAGEPMAADVRPGADGRKAAKLKLLAGVMGVEYDLLRRREAARRQRQLAIVATGSACGFAVTSSLAVFAMISRADAIRQRDIARQKTLTAERTVDFVKSLFVVSDPSEAKGATVTARQILDRGARDLRSGLREEPVVQAELGTTLGEVYLNLGLYRDGEKLIADMMGISHGDQSTRARQYAAFADARTRQGDYERAVDYYSRALKLARAPKSGRPELVPRLLVGLGEARSALEQYDAAAALIAEAMRLDKARLGPSHPDVARDMEAYGLNLIYAGKLDPARPYLDRALAIRLQQQGPTHPRVSEDLNALGGLAYLQRDSTAAEVYYRRALAIDEPVLGANHPDVAMTLNNLARLMLERRAFRDAEPLLERAVAINLSQRDATHDDLAFVFANLAIARRARGEDAGAEDLFRKALAAARQHQHRNLAPILVDLADLRCQAGAGEEALRLLDEAKPIMAKDYPDDPWRVAWVDNTRGACLLRDARIAEGRALLQQSAPVLLARWPKDSLYGMVATRRLAALARGA